MLPPSKPIFIGFHCIIIHVCLLHCTFALAMLKPFTNLKAVVWMHHPL